MKKSSFVIENLLISFPRDREEILHHADNMRKYSSECGCSLGALFLAASLAAYALYLFFWDLSAAHLPRDILWGMLFIFVSSIVGKLIGIGIARIRLALLYRYLSTKYKV